MVTGRISFRVPLYSPISSSVSEVRFTSSCFHWRAETVLVTRISVVAFASAIAPAPTSVLPAPQGSTTTPLPPCQKPSTACFWYGRSAQPSSVELDGVRLAVDVPGEVLGGPAQLQQRLLDLAALGGVHGDRVRVDAGADQRR